MIRRHIYLDHAATTPLLPSVTKTIIKYLDFFGNPSSKHYYGREAQKLLDNARRGIADLINARPNQIIFTSGGTESNNIVARNYRHVITSAIEHPSLLHATTKNRIIPVTKSGQINYKKYRQIIAQAKKPEQTLVSVQLANNELGYIQNIKSLARQAHQKNLKFHTDATQALGKIPIDVQHLNIDFMTLSAHKIGAPAGIGALYVKDSSALNPAAKGGHQESGLRPGTENLLGAVAFGEAAQVAKYTIDYYKTTARKLKNKLQKSLQKKIPHLKINTTKNSLPNILNVSFAGAEGESILLMLDKKKIAVSTGSACATKEIKPSHVLTAINLDPELSHNSIRFSIGLTTTAADIRRTVRATHKIVRKLRLISTVKTEKHYQATLVTARLTSPKNNMLWLNKLLVNPAHKEAK